MTDRLTIINDALLGTGNNPLNAEFDGSVEWRVADSAYRRAVSYLISKRLWNFASQIEPLGSRLPASPHPVLINAFALPGSLLHLEAVWWQDTPFADYEVIDQKLCCVPESELKVKFIRRPLPGQWPEGFVELVTMKVEAFLLRGLNEDTDNARRRDAEVEANLMDVASFSDAQEPARAILKSRSAARRRSPGFR